MSEATEREAFEAWAARCPSLEDDHGYVNLRYLGLHKAYVDATVDISWRVWQAARSQQHQQAGEWISVEDQLPTESGFYAVWLADPSDLGWAVDQPWIAYFDEGEFIGCAPLEDELPVTRWMRLSAPLAVQGDAIKGDADGGER